MGFRIPGDESLLNRRINRSRQAAVVQQKQHDSIIARRIAHMELEEETRQFIESTEFDLMLAAGDLLMRLELQRDENQPRTPDEPWNSAFCMAVELIPEARMLLEEMTIKCIKESKQ